MQVTTPDGRVFTETDQQALAYYRREPGYQVSEGVAVPAPVAEQVVVESGPEADGLPEVAASVVRPPLDASKRDWYDYAVTVDAGLPSYEDITKTELVEKYGGE